MRKNNQFKARRWVRALPAACLAVTSTAGLAQITPPIAPQITPSTLPAQITLPQSTEKDPDAPTGQLSLQEALRIAEMRSPILEIARQGVFGAMGRTKQAAAALNPTLGFTGTYQSVTDFKSSTSNAATAVLPGYGATLTLNQLLFDANASRSQLRQNRALEKAQEQILVRSKIDLALSVKTAYFNLLQSKELVRVAEENYRSREAQKALAKARFDSGLGAPADVVRAQSNLDDSTLQLVRARATELTQAVVLATTMGIDPRTPLVLTSDNLDVTPSPELDALLSTGLANRPEVSTASLNIEAARYGETFARRSEVPTLGLSYALNGRVQNDLNTVQRGTFGLTLSFALGDGGLGSGRRKEAKANREAAESALVQAKLAVKSDVTNAYVGLVSAQQRVEIAKSQVANAQETVRLAEGRYRNGLATFLEVTDAQAALILAQTNQVNAFVAVNQQRALLDRAIGK